MQRVRSVLLSDAKRPNRAYLGLIVTLHHTLGNSSFGLGDFWVTTLLAVDKLDFKAIRDMLRGWQPFFLLSIYLLELSKAFTISGFEFPREQLSSTKAVTEKSKIRRVQFPHRCCLAVLPLPPEANCSMYPPLVSQPRPRSRQIQLLQQTSYRS